MRILITNDDGLGSHGMLHLESELAQLGEVWAVAPDRERSATAMAISIREPLRVIQKDPRRFCVTGFPVDCVNVCLFAEGFPPFDLVVSGINHGLNVGDDVHYSGTVGAARHAAIHGKLALAISTPIRSVHGDFHRPARWLREWLQAHIVRMHSGIVYNINYPDEVEVDPERTLPRWTLTRQGQRRYHDRYTELEESGGSRLIRLAESELGHHEGQGTDFAALEAGQVSVTPLGLDQTHSEEQERWKQILQQDARS